MGQLGPVAQQFMDSQAMVQGIQGPVGSGKTSCSLLKGGIYLGAMQPPNPHGVRKIKLAVIRDTYRNLWRSTIRSWWKWVPQDMGVWRGGQDGPAVHEVALALPDGSRLEAIYEFGAIGDLDAETFLRGYEPTAFLLNEADTQAEDVFTHARSRAGRYPSMSEGGPRWHGVLMDFNAPEFDSWLFHRLIDEAASEGNEGKFAYFCQPGGLDPNAENRHNLPPGYYEEMMRGQPQWWIDRFIHNKFGFARDGMPIWPEYKDRVHCAAEPFAPREDLPIRLGIDGGGTPAAVLGQMMPNGQRRMFDEVVAPKNTFTGPKTFAKMVSLHLDRLYHGLEVDRGCCDPSCAYGGDENNRAWLNEFMAESGIRCVPASTNALTPRFEAVRHSLTSFIDVDTPGFLLSPRCKMLRKAMANGYRLKKLNITGVERYKEEPDKNEYSHVAEAHQYFELGCTDYSAVLGRRADRDKVRVKQSHAVSEDDPWGDGGGPAPRRPWRRQMTADGE